jgi:hypothetical protein
MNDRHAPLIPPLVVDPGRPATATLVGRVLHGEIRGGLKRLTRTLGLARLDQVIPENWAIPDSEFARQAIEKACVLCPPYMVRHCFRSYCFGAILAGRHKLPLDRETFFVAAMLHDLGLCDAHCNDEGSFEWVGARLAHTFCLDAEKNELIAATVHNAIALHTSVGIADRCQPEIALLHFGTGMDLFGMRIDEIPRESLEQVQSEYSRTGFKAEFSPCLSHQAKQKPDSQFAGAAGIGIVDRIQETLKK